MRINRVITALCIINLTMIGLVGYLWVLYKEEQRKQKVEVQTRYITNVVKRIIFRNPENIDTNPPVIFRRWRDLESTDYRIYIRNLRAFGCPEDVIQDIIVADVCRLYDEKRKQFLAENPPKYWKGYDKNVREGYKRLGEEQKALIKELLNLDYDSFIAQLNIPEMPVQPDFYIDFLPSEKQKIVAQLIERVKDELSKNGKFLRNKYILQSDAEIIYKRMLNELIVLLTPEELDEFDLRNSSLARRLKSELSEIDISEGEYRQIYKISDEIESLKRIFNGPEEVQERIWANILELEDQIKQVLGEKRHAEFLKYNDPDYVYISEFANNYNLPKETTEKIYEFKKAFFSEIRRVQDDTSLTFQQRSNIAVALLRETERTLKSLLGDAVYNEYKSYDNDFENQTRNLFIDNTPREPEPELQSTNETISIPMPPWGPYPPPPPPPLKR